MSTDLYEQRVVYAGLMRMTSDRNLIKSAYQHWSTKLADQPFDVFEVVGSLNSYLGLSDAERKVLMMAMHAASNRLVDQLEPIPQYISDGSATVAQDTQQAKPALNTKSVSPHKAVTERYLQLVCQHLRVSSRDSFRELVGIIGDEGLPKLNTSLNKTIKDWGNTGLDKLNFANAVAPGDCQDVALEFYVLLTEVVGPVNSDVIVNKAIAEVLNMAEAQQFDPRSLL